jgi:stearoyl-CoA desaturase (Delta-9 desaturase)
MHSPLRRGFWYAQVGWVLGGAFDRPDLSNVKDLSRFPELRLLDRHRWMPIAGYAASCWLVGGLPGFVWGFAVSTVAVFHATGSINSLAHLWGSRRFDTPDESRNNGLLALFTFGEGWHNNHHACMTAARQGCRWWEVDASWYSLRLLAWLGLVWDLRGRPAGAATADAAA